MDLRFTATHRYARIAPRKARYVIDMIRHKPVNDALQILRFSNRRAAGFIDKVLRSALANAGEEALKKKLNIDADKLVVREAIIDGAGMFKRWRARSRGMANPILKRNSHITIVLAPADPSKITKFGEKKSKKRAAALADAKPAESTPSHGAASGESKPEGKE